MLRTRFFPAEDVHLSISRHKPTSHTTHRIISEYSTHRTDAWHDICTTTIHAFAGRATCLDVRFSKTFTELQLSSLSNIEAFGNTLVLYADDETIRKLCCCLNACKKRNHHAAQCATNIRCFFFLRGVQYNAAQKEDDDLFGFGGAYVWTRAVTRASVAIHVKRCCPAAQYTPPT